MKNGRCPKCFDKICTQKSRYLLDFSDLQESRATIWCKEPDQTLIMHPRSSLPRRQIGCFTKNGRCPKRFDKICMSAVTTKELLL